MADMAVVMRRLATKVRAAGPHEPGELEMCDLLEAAADAWPINHAEPPRNPRDRRLVLAVAAFAAAMADDDEPAPRRHYDKPGTP